MAKSVLVIEKPEKCIDCPCSCFTEDAQADHCAVTDSEISDPNEVLKDCPLKDLPKSRPCNYYDFEHYTSGYDKGWNDFRDAIYKDNEKEDQSYECNDREL